MRRFFLSPKLARLAAAVAVMLLFGAGSAAAGDGGGDAGTLQSFLNTICQSLGFTVPPTPNFTCPQLPTVTQGSLEVAGLGYARPEAIRRFNNVPPGSVFAGNPSPIPGNPVVPVTLPVTPQAFSNLALTPLAFISGGFPPKSQAFAPVTQLYDPNANSFFSAVTTYGSVGGNPQPQTLNLFYDDLSRRSQLFITGQEVAKISLPLVVYDSSTCTANPSTGCSETEVMTILDVRATCSGGPNCLTAYATADFSAFGSSKCSSSQPCTAADLGIGFAVVFGSSPTSSTSHAIFEVQVPMIVTVANDPVHFNANFNSPQVNLIGTATFGVEDLGAPLAFLPGKVIGVATYPGPMTVSGATTAYYGFCASLPDNFARLNPSVAAFLDIATDGEALVSTPLGESSMPALTCPF